MKKTYWKVESEFGAGGKFIGAYLYTPRCEEKPRNTAHSRKAGVVFYDWRGEVVKKNEGTANWEIAPSAMESGPPQVAVRGSLM
jgi:hypothetical protein